MRFILADIKKGMLTIPLKCLDNATMDRLYNTTYDAERELSSLVAHRADAPNTPEAKLRADFAAAANTTLCSAVISELKESPELRGLIVRYLATRADVATQARRASPHPHPNPDPDPDPDPDPNPNPDADLDLQIQACT